MVMSSPHYGRQQNSVTSACWEMSLWQGWCWNWILITSISLNFTIYYILKIITNVKWYWWKWQLKPTQIEFSHLRLWPFDSLLYIGCYTGWWRKVKCAAYYLDVSYNIISVFKHLQLCPWEGPATFQIKIR